MIQFEFADLLRLFVIERELAAERLTASKWTQKILDRT
jgi:hypothetical protein